jgi:hypothetical protein
MLKIAYQVLSKTVIWIAPFIIVLSSIIFTLPDGQMHKRTLANSNFYDQLSEELQNSEIQIENGQIGFGTILYGTVLKDLATSGWLKNFSETNIDNFTNWLSGDVEAWVLYVPVQDVELSAASQIDQQVASLEEQYGDNLPVCSEGQAETLRVERFSLNNEFCIPETVKNGEESLTEFLGITEEDTKTGEFLEKLVRNNPLNNTSSNFKLDDFEYYTLPRQQFFDNLNLLRDGFLFVRSYLVYILIFVAAAFAALLIISKLVGKKASTEFRRFLFYTSIGIFTLSAAIILFLGGTIYFTSIVQNFLLPGFTTSTIITLIAFEAVKFGFNIVSYAFWAGVIMITLNFFLQYADSTGLFSDTDEKNQNIQKFKQTRPEPSVPVTTFDSQFKNSVNGSQDITSQSFNQEPDFGSQANPAFDQTYNAQDFSSNPQTPNQVQASPGAVNYNSGDNGFQNGYQTPPPVQNFSNPNNNQGQGSGPMRGL